MGLDNITKAFIKLYKEETKVHGNKTHFAL